MTMCISRQRSSLTKARSLIGRHQWLVVLLLLSQVSLPGQEKLRVWLVLNEPAVAVRSPDPLRVFDDFVDEWSSRGIDLRHLRHRAEQRPEFVAQLLGQRNILTEIADFRRNQAGFPLIEAHFFDWHEYGQIVRTHAEHLRPDL